MRAQVDAEAEVEVAEVEVEAVEEVSLSVDNDNDNDNDNVNDNDVDSSYVFVTNTDAHALHHAPLPSIHLIDPDSTHSDSETAIAIADHVSHDHQSSLDDLKPQTHLDDATASETLHVHHAITPQTSLQESFTISGQPLVQQSAVDDGEDLESPSASASEDNQATQLQLQLQLQVAYACLPEILPAEPTQETVSDAADLVDSTQQYGFSDVSSTLTSPSETCNASLQIHCGENFSGPTVGTKVKSSDVGNGGLSLLSRDLPTDEAGDVSPDTDSRDSNGKSMDNTDSCHVEKEISSVIIDPETNSPANDGLSEPETTGASNGGDEDQLCPTDESSAANKTLEYPSSQDTSSDCTDLGSDIGVDHETSLPDSQAAAADDKPETGVAYASAQSSGDGDGDGISLKEEEGSGSPLACNCDLEDAGREVKSISQEIEGVDGEHKDQISSSPEHAAQGQNVGAEVVKKPFYFFIRMPRYDDENLRDQIKLAEGQVQERTKTRDVLRAKIQMERVSAKECGDKVRAALTEERAARDAFKSKRQEMDSVQSVINKLKNALSVEDIDSRIRNMEHMIEHETLPLKEEKQLIREIKQLKQHREQISSNMGNQDEVQKALEQKDQVEERLKGLRKELDVLRVELSKVEEVTQTAKQQLNKENEKLNELVYQFKAADGIRQEAYAHLQSLKKQQYEKNKQFWRYKDDAKAAQKLALSGDKEQLQHLCVDQVERIMELWNKDDDFRREYLRCNTRSTLRRLRTLDGRSLGPDEEPPIIPIAINSRGAKDNAVTLTSTPEQERENPPVKEEKLDSSSGANVVEQKKQADKKKKPAKLTASSGRNPSTFLDEDERQEEREEEVSLSKEEEEVATKAEEKKKEEEAAKLKKQLKLEEKAKAKEAMERKKRIAEKAQARAAIRAQKEAEEKEKEREKRARKKERKKANGKTNESADQGLSAAATCTPSSEIPTSPNECADETAAVAKEKPLATGVKRPPQKSKTKAIMPAPLRNRGKRRMQSWIMWASLALVFVLALILLANNQLLI